MVVKVKTVDDKGKLPVTLNAAFYDAIVIGAGASGLYCAMTAGQRGRHVLVLDHANKAGKKILMSGGGRCNFTNYEVTPAQFIGTNAHFCKSALSRYSQWEFIGLVAKHGIDYEERECGQLFCQHSAKDIVNMLIDECQLAGVTIKLKTAVRAITASTELQSTCQASHDTQLPAINFIVETTDKAYTCTSLVIATGGLSIPTMGATGFAYDVAKQFGHQINTTEAALVPFTFTDEIHTLCQSLSGLSLLVEAFNERISFKLPMLFTHRGLSGPAMLQLSNYWYVGEPIHINLLPSVDAADVLLKHKVSHPKQRTRAVLSKYLPKRLLLTLQDYLWAEVKDTELANIKDGQLSELGHALNNWKLKPSGTEGYRTAEVTRGGIATDEISSKTMQSLRQPHLYFIGEALDVTGWLGGYNFQWAWASGFVCGEVV